MPTLASLMNLVGQPLSAPAVQALVVDEQLLLLKEPDLEEGELPRGYLSCREGGYLFLFVDGHLKTLFVFILPNDEFQPFPGPLVADLLPAATRLDVRAAFGQPERSGEAKNIPPLGHMGSWDRYRYGDLYLHFEYTEAPEQVKQITVMTADIAPMNVLR